MACISNALIIGGGIAGLASAIALAKAGVQCHVVELAEAPLGASIGLSGHSAETLVELGVYEECYANGTPHLPGRDAASLSDAQGCLIRPQPGTPFLAGRQDRHGDVSARTALDSERCRAARRRNSSPGDYDQDNRLQS